MRSQWATWLAELGAAAMHSVRMVRRSPGFAAVAVLTIGLGVGVNTSIFGVVNEVFLRSAPHVIDPARLINIRRTLDGQEYLGFGHLQFTEYRRQVRLIGMSAARNARVIWREGDRAQVLSAALVTANYFRILGVRIAAGRDFSPDEDRTPGAHPVAMVSNAMWRNSFGSDTAIIGRRLRIADTEFTIIGVGPAGFRGVEVGEQTDVWIPLMMEAETRAAFPTLNSDFFQALVVTGRLAPGVTAREAQAELASVATRVEQRQRIDGKHWSVAVTQNIRMPDQGDREDASRILGMFLAAAVLVLLIVCANLAALVAARGIARRPEIAIRMALGADRKRLMFQLVAENLALALPGAAVGVVVSRLVTGVIAAAYGPELDLSIDPIVIGFASLVAVMTCAGFSLVPALDLVRADVATPLTGATARHTTRPLLRHALVSAQMALSLVLLAGAGLFLRTLQKSAAVDVGFETDHLVLAHVDLELAGYSDARAVEFYRQLTDGIASLPGVAVVSSAGSPPVNRGFFGGAREIELEPDGGTARALRMNAEYNDVAPEYVRGVGTSVIRGRDLKANDNAGSARVALVNEAFANAVWPGGDPIGRRFRFVLFMAMSEPVEVVGVVRDTRVAALDSRPRPEVLVPAAQAFQKNRFLIVRTTMPAPVIAEAVRARIHLADPGLPPVPVQTATEWLHASLGEQRLIATLITAFGAVALLLAALGLYGTQSFAVSRRSREIGVRMALGATRRSVLWLVARQALVVVVPGVSLGLIASVVMMRFIKSSLYGVTATDPVAFIMAIVLLAAVAVLASWVPARRAAGVDPVRALRHD